MNQFIDMLAAEKSFLILFLSPDLYYLIIEYYTNHYHDLLFLRQINLEWKKYAESSLLWVRFARLGLLSFYAPEEYVQHFAKSSKFLEMSKKDQLAFIRRFSPQPEQYQIHELCHSSTADFKEGIFWVLCSKSNSAKESEETSKLIEIEISSLIACDRFEEANAISRWYLDLLTTHHHHWKEQVQVIQRMKILLSYVESDSLAYFNSIITFIGLALSALSSYGLYTLQRNLQEYGKLYWENYLSFICVDFVLSIIIAFKMIENLFDLLKMFDLATSTDLSYFINEIYKSNRIDFLAIIIEIFLLSIMIEVILSHPIIPWFILIIPIGIFLFFALYRSCLTTQFLPLILHVLVAISVILYTLIADNVITGIRYPYGIPLIPMFPIFLGINIFLIDGIAKTIGLSVYTICACLVILLNVLLCIYAFQPDLSTNSWIGVLPPVFVVYLYLNCLVAAYVAY